MKASVIIPTYNSYERLFYTLNVLNQQDCPRDQFEVILINNGSTDNTARMLPTLKLNYKFVNITLPKVMSRAYARNKGILQAKNDLIIFLDSDMLANKDFIRKHIEAHSFEKSIVCGNIWRRIFTYYYPRFSNDQKNLFNSQILKHHKLNASDYRAQQTTLIRIDQITSGRYQDFCFDADSFYKDTWQQYGNNLDGYHFEWLYFVTRNCSVRKASLLENGLFDESFTGWGAEDTDIGYRLCKNGHKLIVQPNLLSVHQEHPKSSADIHVTVGNKVLLLRKYNTIDILLPFLGGGFGLKVEDLNKVMMDIQVMKEDQDNHPIIELFNHALIDQRNKLYSNTPVPNSKPFDEAFVKAACVSLNQNLKVHYFTSALCKLFKEVYGIVVEY